MSDQDAGATPSVLASADGVSAVDLGTLFRRDASPTDRMRALQAFGATVRTRMQGVAEGADALGERCGLLLAELVDWLPIRRAEELRQELGDDPARLAQRVIDDNVVLAKWLWTAAISAGGPAVHAAKVVLHSAIEIRMVGELFEAHRDPTVDGVATPLPVIIAAWVSGAPDGPPWSTSSVVGVLVAQTRRAMKELPGVGGVFSVVKNRRKGEEIVRGVGEKMDGALRRRAIA